MTNERTVQDMKNNDEREYLLSQRWAEMRERDKRIARYRDAVIYLIILLGALGTISLLFVG